MSEKHEPVTGHRLALALFLLLVAGGGLAIGFLTAPGEWYAGLAKPPFNPPNGVFGPVWTTLYLLMAFALWRVLRLPAASAKRRWALSLFFTQLVLNAAWSWMFFAARNPLLAVC